MPPVPCSVVCRSLRLPQSLASVGSCSVAAVSPLVFSFGERTAVVSFTLAPRTSSLEMERQRIRCFCLREGGRRLEPLPRALSSSLKMPHHLAGFAPRQQQTAHPLLLEALESRPAVAWSGCSLQQCSAHRLASSQSLHRPLLLPKRSEGSRTGALRLFPMIQCLSRSRMGAVVSERPHLQLRRF